MADSQWLSNADNIASGDLSSTAPGQIKLPMSQIHDPAGQTMAKMERIAKAALVQRIESIAGPGACSGLDLGALAALDHSLAKLHEAGAQALDNREAASLFATKESSKIAEGHGIPKPAVDESGNFAQQLAAVRMEQLHNATALYVFAENKEAYSSQYAKVASSIHSKVVEGASIGQAATDPDVVKRSFFADLVFPKFASDALHRHKIESVQAGAARLISDAGTPPGQTLPATLDEFMDNLHSARAQKEAAMDAIAQASPSSPQFQ